MNFVGAYLFLSRALRFDFLCFSQMIGILSGFFSSIFSDCFFLSSSGMESLNLRVAWFIFSDEVLGLCIFLL